MVKHIKDHLGNEYDSINSLCMDYNISYNTFRLRLKRGWSLKDALTVKVRKKKNK